MNMLVWVMMGIAIWHFAVFVPDHFWGGIVGAFGAAILGAVVIGLCARRRRVDDASLATALEAIPGRDPRARGLVLLRPAPRSHAH